MQVARPTGVRSVDRTRPSQASRSRARRAELGRRKNGLPSPSPCGLRSASRVFFRVRVRAHPMAASSHRFGAVCKQVGVAATLPARPLLPAPQSCKPHSTGICVAGNAGSLITSGVPRGEREQRGRRRNRSASARTAGGPIERAVRAARPPKCVDFVRFLLFGERSACSRRCNRATDTSPERSGASIRTSPDLPIETP